jgi:hypothetical protein
MVTQRKNAPLYAALQFEQTISITLLLFARNLLADGEATHISQVAKSKATWDELPGANVFPYSLSFSTKV